VNVPIAAFERLTSLGAAELVAELRSGGISATAAVEAHIARIEGFEPALNAIVVRRFDRARAEAAAADAAAGSGEPLGPLHGLPITLKEQFLLEGTPTTFGFEWRRMHVAGHTGPVVSALRAAGAIVLGKTNVSQTLGFHEADNPVYGITRNPWDVSRTPGGSSGGEAAIIAAGGSPLGLGGDLGGSIRIPAHFTGVAALKPTSGRLPPDDTPSDIATVPRQLPAQPGPMARDVGDLHLAMSIMTRLVSRHRRTCPHTRPSSPMSGAFEWQSSLTRRSFARLPPYAAPFARRLLTSPPRVPAWSNSSLPRSLRHHGSSSASWPPIEGCGFVPVFMATLRTAGSRVS